MGGPDRKRHICLSDFDTSKVYSAMDPLRTAWRGTPTYASPEVQVEHEVHRYDNRCDIHSLGVTFNVMLRREKRMFFRPSDAYNPDSGFEERLVPTKDVRPDFPGEFRDLVSNMFHHSAECRPTSQNVKGHKFFKDVNWKDLCINAKA